MPRECLIVVASVHHGNTATVAAALAGVLDATVAAPAEVSPERLADHRLVGFGSGVYYGRLHDDLMAWVRGLPDGAAAGTPAFVFSTSGLPWLAKLWHAPLERLLARKGFDVVGSFGCRGFDTWGPLWLTGGLNRTHPDKRDLARARDFARRVAAALSASKRAG